MSTRCKLDPNVRLQRTERRDFRRRLDSMQRALLADGQVLAAGRLGGLLERLKRITNHARFIAAIAAGGL